MSNLPVCECCRVASSRGSDGTEKLSLAMDIAERNAWKAKRSKAMVELANIHLSGIAYGLDGSHYPGCLVGNGDLDRLQEARRLLNLAEEIEYWWSTQEKKPAKPLND